MRRPGLYIVFEGLVGTGKTTQSKKLTQFLKEKFPNREVTWTFEPGGTEIAKGIRKVVQGTKFKEEMSPICEAYLYAAARAQSLSTSVLPVLNKNGIVVSDRSFITSLAYQGIARKLGIEKVLEINRVTIEGLCPDLIIYLSLDPQLGLSRTFNKGGDKFENEDIKFFKKIDLGYKKISKLPLFKDRWITIKADGDISEVFHKILKKAFRRYPSLSTS